MPAKHPAFTSLLFRYDENSAYDKMKWLDGLLKNKPNKAVQLSSTMESLLFMLAHPDNEAVFNKANSTLKAISQVIKKNKSVQHQLADSGWPYTQMVTRFSHDLTQYLLNSKGVAIQLDSFERDGLDLNSLLKLTLPNTEKEETTAGLSNAELLDVLKIPTHQQVTFLVQQFEQLNQQALVKTHLWENMKAFFVFHFTAPFFSKAFNALSFVPIYYHNQLLKKFNHGNLLSAPLPKPLALTSAQQEETIAVIKRAMVVSMRETDTSTYLHPSSLRLYALERGISIALYGMQSDYQLPLQSYIGYTLFKNGYPMAYGGSWIFGDHAKFGLNIFEWFRGGESGYVLCQLLRTYIQAFNLKQIEIDAYQFGKDNPDGIKSGAFWFYYRYGFRPINNSNKILANKESIKIQSNKEYRSSEKTLVQLADTNMLLVMKKNKQSSLEDILIKTNNMIAKQYKGNRTQAIFESEKLLLSSLPTSLPKKQYAHALQEWSMVANALKIRDINQWKLIGQLIMLKEKNPYQYNEVLKQLFH